MGWWRRRHCLIFPVDRCTDTETNEKLALKGGAFVSVDSFLHPALCASSLRA